MTTPATTIINLIIGAILGIFVTIAIYPHIVSPPLEDAVNVHSHDHVDIHPLYEAPTDGTAPTITLVAHEDPKSGWNIELQTTNFTFAPELASLEHEEGMGHAHVYINGEKINRIYGNWYHLSELPDGEVEVKVSLSTNDHREYALNGLPIADTVIISGHGH